MKPSPTSPYVEAFAEMMEEKLDANRHKGDRNGWMRLTVGRLLRLLRKEVEELECALEEGKPEQAVAEEAADVANFAMMIADRVGGLELSKEKT